MKEYIDPVTKIKYKIYDNEILSVYIRRANGPKRLVHSTRNAAKIFELYHRFKVFKGDRKYLESSLDGRISTIFNEAGTDIKPPTSRGRMKDINYKHATIHAIPRVPITLIDELSKLLQAQRVPNTSHKVTRNNLIPMLLAYFCYISQDEREKIIESGYQSFITHKMKSGGNITNSGEEVFANAEENDDLL